MNIADRVPISLFFESCFEKLETTHIYRLQNMGGV
jgi:hypothetical protein